MTTHQSLEPAERRMVVVLLGALFIALLGVGIIAPIIPIYAMDLGATGISVGIMIGAFAVSRGILQPIVGSLSDRQGRKRYLVAGLFIYAVVGVTYTLATSVTHLIWIRLFHGVGAAMIVPVVMAYIADLAPPKQEGKYMGILNIALFAGIGGGPLLGGVFRDTMGINSAFYAMSALAAASLGLILVLLPPGGPDRMTPLTAGLLATLRRILHSRRVIGMLLPRVATMIVMVPTLVFLPLLMDRLMGATGTEIGIVIATRTIANAGLQTPFGRMVDRYDKVRLLLIGCFAMSAAMFVVPFATTLLQLILLFGFMGIGEALVWPTLGAIAVEEGHSYGQGSMMGVFNMAMSVGILIGSLIAGFSMDLLGLRFVFYVVSTLLVVSAVAGSVMIRV